MTRTVVDPRPYRWPDYESAFRHERGLQSRNKKLQKIAKHGWIVLCFNIARPSDAGSPNQNMEELARAEIVWFGDFRFDRRRALLTRQSDDGNLAPVAIGSRALEILGLLIDRQGELVSRDDILNAVWPRVVEGANVTVQISALRRVLDEGRSDGSLIQTVPGRGYRLAAPVIHRAQDPQLDPSALTRDHASLRPRLSVVLPFTNLSNDPDQQYFADGITEDLTIDLSRIWDMFVISCTTAFTYRNKSVPTKQSGRELGVRYVLEGRRPAVG